MADEIEIYKATNIQITNLRAVFGSKTYSVANITSVEAKTISPGGCAPIALIVIGVLFMLSAAAKYGETDSWIVTLFIGLGVFGAGMYVATSAKEDHGVKLTTAGGEVTAYQSKDKAEIQAIVSALNEAIIKKG